MSKGKNTLIISYETEVKWIDPILGAFSNSDKLLPRYRSNLDLIEWGISISTKLDIIRIIINRLNITNAKIVGELKADNQNVEIHLNNKWAYQVKNIQEIYILIAYFETIVFEMYSSYELLKDYVTNFSDVIQRKLRTTFQSQYRKICEIEQWEKDIKNIRDDLIHNYTGWVNYEKSNNEFLFTLELPSIKKTGKKKFKASKIDVLNINNLVKGYVIFLDFTRNFLINEINNAIKP